MPCVHVGLTLRATRRRVSCPVSSLRTSLTPTSHKRSRLVPKMSTTVLSKEQSSLSMKLDASSELLPPSSGPSTSVGELISLSCLSSNLRLIVQAANGPNWLHSYGTRDDHSNHLNPRGTQFLAIHDRSDNRKFPYLLSLHLVALV